MCAHTHTHSLVNNNKIKQKMFKYFKYKPFIPIIQTHTRLYIRLLSYGHVHWMDTNQTYILRCGVYSVNRPHVVGGLLIFKWFNL